jgi:hypothetical protein
MLMIQTPPKTIRSRTRAAPPGASARALGSSSGTSPSTRTWSRELTVANDYTIHQLAPYIGRMKTSMAEALVSRWTRQGDLVVDPFCGCGVIAVEAAAKQRRVIVGDWNPYAVLLSKGKLFAPENLTTAERKLRDVWELSRSLLGAQDLRRVPRWVRSFFHPETLRSALAFRDACVETGNSFLLACLLGILHHQRPGFLSYPSSHLVPYLRSRKFPRRLFPALYRERDVLSRITAKVRRSYRRPAPKFAEARRVLLTDARRFPRVQGIDAVITSPPYMNELDYVRDNRLRLWFIDRSIPTGLELRGRDRENAFFQLLKLVCHRITPQVKLDGHVVLVVGDATRGGARRGRTAALSRKLFETDSALSDFRLIELHRDTIPDIRRSRRECRGTKTETVMVYRRERV